MNKYLFPIYAVIAGFIFVKLWLKNRPAGTAPFKLLLAFSGAFLLSMTFFELMPEVLSYMEPKKMGLLIMVGLIIQALLEILSKGAEHGHIHADSDTKSFPWFLFISLCLHSLLEGFPINQHNDMVYGVLIHKIPIAILITSYLVRSNFSNLNIAFFLFIFAIMTPLGTLISNAELLSEPILQSLNALVIGIFFHISTTILFETSEGHSFNARKFVVILLAIAIAYFV